MLLAPRRTLSLSATRAVSARSKKLIALSLWLPGWSPDGATLLALPGMSGSSSVTSFLTELKYRHCPEMPRPFGNVKPARNLCLHLGLGAPHVTPYRPSQRYLPSRPADAEARPVS